MLSPIVFPHTDDASRAGTETPSLTWFVAASESRQEFGVVAALAELGIEAWSPAQIKWRKSPRRKTTITLPLLPGYVFVGLTRDEHGDFPFPNVRAIDGVVAMLGSCGEPRPIPFGEPDPNFMRADRGGKGERKPRTLWELRAMEAAGTFDLTKDAGAAKAIKEAKVILHTFADLAAALAETTS